jgi:hypothetical protein
MYSNMTRVGQLQLELAFNYGLYGYGHSPQLSDAMGSFEQLPPELRVRHSLYPRVQPPDDRTDFASATLIPPAVTPFPMPMHARAGAHTHDHHQPPTTTTIPAHAPNPNARLPFCGYSEAARCNNHRYRAVAPSLAWCFAAVRSNSRQPHRTERC